MGDGKNELFDGEVVYAVILNGKIREMSSTKEKASEYAGYMGFADTQIIRFVLDEKLDVVNWYDDEDDNV